MVKFLFSNGKFPNETFTNTQTIIRLGVVSRPHVLFLKMKKKIEIQHEKYICTCGVLVIPCTFKCKQFLNNLKFCMVRREKEINCTYFNMFMAPLKSSIRQIK